MALEDALAWLDSTKTPQGAWPYLPGGDAMVEPTLYAHAAGAAASLEWLRRSELGWGWLILPLAVEDEALRAQAAERILSAEGIPGPVPGDYDGALVGWSWTEGTASWVQPTAWALASLGRLGLEDHPRARAGVALLEDRQSLDGGWNAGTPNVLGVEVPGYLYLTGWVCMALPPSDAVDRGLAFLRGVEDHPSTMNLALAILARRAHGLDVSGLSERLLTRQHDDGSFGPHVDRTALAAWALRP